MSRNELIKQKIRQTIEKLAREPIDMGEFARRFEEITGWEYTFDEYPKTIKEENKGKWHYETVECIDTVDIDDTTYADVHATEEWAIDYENQDWVVAKMQIKEIRVNKE